MGAVNELLSHELPTGQALVLCCGADRVVAALEPRMSLQPLHLFKEHRDHVYSLRAVGQYALSGGGDGLVLVHDLTHGALRYGLGANRAAVRCLWADRHLMVAAGDDGSIIAYDYGVAAASLPPEPPPAFAAAAAPRARSGRATVDLPSSGCDGGTAAAMGQCNAGPPHSGARPASRPRLGAAAPAVPRPLGGGGAGGGGGGGGMSSAQAYAAKKKAAVESELLP